MENLVLYRSIGSEKSLADRVTDELEQLILSGKLKEGEKLPPERELAESFGVSRTVVREGIRILQSRGLLQVRPGIGSIVRSPSSDQVIGGISRLIRAKADGIKVSLVSLHEVRTLLEIDITEMAVERATAEDIEAIRRVLEELETLINLPLKFLEKAVEFHRRLAIATHNPLLVVLFDALQEIQYGMRQTLVPEPIQPEKALNAFRQILKGVEAGDSASATDAIQQHLFEIWKQFEISLSKIEADRE